jgi:hypothetical protein
MYEYRVVMNACTAGPCMVGHRIPEGGEMVSLTDTAVKKFKEVVTQQGGPGDGVRIFLVPGG